MNRLWPALLALLIGAAPLFAQAPAETGDVDTAIGHLRNLEYDAASQQLRTWIASHPDDCRAWNYLAVTILYREMFRQGVLESKVYGQGGDAFKASKVPVSAEFQQELLSVLNRAQGAADERLRAKPSDPEALYWAGVAHGTRATYHFTLRKEYKAAIREADAAYKEHSKLLKLDPAFTDAYLVVGMNRYVVGSLPWYLKIFAALSGRHGNKTEGLREVKRVTEGGHYAREDAKLMLAVLYQREGMHGEALALYQNMARSYPRNYLLQQEVATLFGMTGDWKAAAETYESMLAAHAAAKPGYENLPVARVLYLAGQAQEKLGNSGRALELYTSVTLQGSDPYVERCRVAAQELRKND